MINRPSILDAAYAKLMEFGPDLGLSKEDRLTKEFPALNPDQRKEILDQLEMISKTVWSLAERGGEAKMKKSEIVAELQAAYPYLTGPGLTRALFLTNYYAWHEGYQN